MLLWYDVLLFHITVCGSSASLVWSCCPCYCGMMFYYFILQYVEVQSVWYGVVVLVTAVRCSISYYSMWKFSQFGMELLSMLLQYDVLLFHITVCGSSASLVWSCCPCYCSMMFYYFILQYVEVQPVWYGVVVHVTAVRCSIISYYSMWKFSQFGMELLSMLLWYDVLLFHITVFGSSASLVWSCCPCYCCTMFYFILQYVEVQPVWYGVVVHVTAVRCSIISYYSMWKFSQFGMELLSMLLRYDVLLFHITVCGSSVSLVWSCCPCYCGTMFYYFILQYVEVQPVWYGAVVHVTAVRCSIISYYSMWKFSQFGMELLSMLLQYDVLFHITVCGSSVSLVWSCCPCYCGTMFYYFILQYVEVQPVWYGAVVHITVVRCSISYYSMWKFSQFGMELLSMLLQYDVLFHITVCGSSVSLVWSCCPCYCGTMFYYFILQYVEVQPVWYGVVVHVTAVLCSIISYYSMWKFSQFGMELLSMLLRYDEHIISHYSMWKFSQFGMDLLSMLLHYDVLLFHITVCGSSVSLVWSCCPCYCGTMFYFILQYVEVQSVWYGAVVHVTVVRCSISYYSMWKFSQFGMELLSMLLRYDVLLFHITVCGSSVSLVWSCCLCYCSTMFYYFILQYVEVQPVWYGAVVHVTVVRCSIISHYSMWKFSQFGMELLSMLLLYDVLLFHITVCGSSVSLVWSCCPCYCGTVFYYFTLQYVEVQPVWYGVVVHVTAVRCSIISYYSMWKFSQFGMELLSMLLQYDVLLFHITVCGSSVSLVWSCCPCYCCTMFYYFTLQYVEVQSVWYGAVVHVTVVRCSIISYYSMWKFSQFGMELLSMLLRYDVLLFHITVCGSSASLVWSCCPCYCGTMNILFHITVCGSSVSLVWSCCPCYCGMMFYYFILQYVEVQSVWYGAVVHVTAVRCSIISYYSMWKFSQFGMELLSMLLLYDVLFHITVCGSSASLVWSCCPCYCSTMFYYFILQYVEVQPVWYGAVVHVTVV